MKYTQTYAAVSQHTNGSPIATDPYVFLHDIHPDIQISPTYPPPKTQLTVETPTTYRCMVPPPQL